MSDEVARTQGTDIEKTVYPDTMEGTDVLGGGISRWSYNAADGLAVFSQTDEAVTELSMVILAGAASRVYFPKRYKEGEKSEVKCKSKDAMVPFEDDYLEPQAEYCNACEKAGWGDEGEAPKCTLTYTFLAVEYPANGPAVPFLLDFKRSQLKAMNKYLKLIRGRKGQPIFAFVTKVKFDAEFHDGTVPYYTPSFTIEEELGAEEIDEFYQMLVKSRGVQVAQDEMDVSADSVDMKDPAASSDVPF